MHVPDDDRGDAVRWSADRAVRAVAVVALVVVADRIAELTATPTGIPLWWLPAAVMTVHALRGRATATVPVLVVAGVLAGIATPDPGRGELLSVVVTATATALGYVAAAGLLRRVRARHTGRLARTVGFVVATIVIGPVLAAVGGELALSAIGGVPLEAAVRRGSVVAVGHAAAVMTVVPLARFLLAREWVDDHGPGAWTSAAVLAAAGLVLGAFAPGWSVEGQSLMYLLGAPLLLASAANRAWIVEVVTAATGVGVAVGLAAATAGAALAAQLTFLGLAVVASVLTALARTERSRRDVRTVMIGGVIVAGRQRVLAGVARITRWARAGLVVVLLVGAVELHLDGWVRPGPPAWALAAVAPLVLLSANALSLYLDAVEGQSARRQRWETIVDVAAVVAISALVAPLVEPDVLVLAQVVVLVAAALRLSAAVALAVGLVQVVAITTIATTATPWSAPAIGISATRTATQVVLSVLVVWLVSWTSDQLHASRDQVTALAAEQALLNDRLTTSRDDLARAYEVLAERSAQLERAEAEAVAAAAEERRARDDYERFAAVVAHDLASPLATIGGITTMLQRSDLDQQTTQDLLASAVNSSRRAGALVDRLHEHARAGSWALDPVPVPLADLAEGVVVDHRASLEATGSTVEIDPGLPTASCDRVLVHQLLSNLVGNALRHGADEHGTARVRISGQVVGDVVAVTVADDGPGVDPDVAAQLFDIGVRGDRSRGLGLGMSTCRTVVERHGGTIELDPAARSGTAVTFTLPAVAARLVVLVVEADDDVRQLCRLRMGGPSGADVVEAGTRAEAVDAVATLPTIDAALVGVDLPDGSGIDLLTELARMQVPTRLLTDRVRRSDVAAAARHGVPLADRATMVQELDVRWALAPLEERPR